MNELKNERTQSRVKKMNVYEINLKIDSIVNGIVGIGETFSLFEVNVYTNFLYVLKIQATAGKYVIFWENFSVFKGGIGDFWVILQNFQAHFMD